MSLRQKIQDVVAAVTNPGPLPSVHFRRVEKLRKEWPTLHDAVMALVDSEWVPNEPTTHNRVDSFAVTPGVDATGVFTIERLSGYAAPVKSRYEVEVVVIQPDGAQLRYRFDATSMQVDQL